MDQQRQKAFQKLRPACVELSSVALKFKGNQTSVRDVLHGLDEQFKVLEKLGLQNQLDEKLAEYSFFPLTHVFNESQRLSPRCMQVAVQSVTILVSSGWRVKLAPQMGKQLLILMSLIAGGNPRRQAEPPTDELKRAAFKCIETLIKWLALSPTGKTIFDDQSTRNVVDQLAYLLVDSLTEATSDIVQVAAAEALLELNASMSNRVFLASLLPRTVSSLTKALRSSTQARRTRKVLVTNLQLLGAILKSVLADDVVSQGGKDEAEREVLDDSWLKATAAQIKNALAQVCKLRSHDQVDVRKALFDLCIMLIEDCSKALQECIFILIETSVVLTGTINDEAKAATLKNLIFLRSELGEALQSSFYDWSQSLPRVMQGSDDRPKDLMLARITYSFEILNETLTNTENLTNVLGSTILKSVAATIEADRSRSIQTFISSSDQYMSLVRQKGDQIASFEPVLFNHQSQKDLAQSLQTLIYYLQRHPSAGKIVRSFIDSMPGLASDQKLAPIWLAIQLLQRQSDSLLDLDDILDYNNIPSDRDASRSYLIQDLYAQTKDILLDSSPYSAFPQYDYRVIALSLELVALQAEQLGQAYRIELYETLYPILALLSSRDNIIQHHAITTLNSLASSCGYGSVSALLIENVDYLVNSIAWKLNTFNLSPEAPAVLNMVIRLIGAKVIPYLDDLIASIFAALDSFHGYAQWVEMLFEVLKTMVDESVKNPQLSVTDKTEVPHKKTAYKISTVDDIMTDLQARKRRKLTSGTSTHLEDRESAPQRPWTKQQDDPNYKPDPTEGKDLETLLREAETADEENDLPAPKEQEDEDPTKPLNKSHELLLKIAQATVPHLSSPSPRVRQTLLQLLTQISPLLARHENTFLPLVNAIWPGLVQRLFTDITISTSTSTSDDQPRQGETAYNVAAAATVIASLCENAGDFMANRIEQIFGQLKTMYSKAWKDVAGQMARDKTKQAARKTPGSMIEDTAGTHIKGIVDLQVVRNESGPLASPLRPDIGASASSASPSTISRSSTGQVFTSLVYLLVAILGHVRLGGDNAEEIFELLASLLDRPGEVGEVVGEAMETYNSDAVWVMRCRRTGEEEIEQGVRSKDDRVWRGVEMPVLRESSRSVGITLQPVVF